MTYHELVKMHIVIVSPNVIAHHFLSKKTTFRRGVMDYNANLGLYDVLL
jgi:hypothetical protein